MHVNCSLTDYRTGLKLNVNSGVSADYQPHSVTNLRIVISLATVVSSVNGLKTTIFKDNYFIHFKNYDIFSRTCEVFEGVCKRVIVLFKYSSSTFVCTKLNLLIAGLFNCSSCRKNIWKAMRTAKRIYSVLFASPF